MGQEFVKADVSRWWNYLHTFGATSSIRLGDALGDAYAYSISPCAPDGFVNI